MYEIVGFLHILTVGTRGMLESSPVVEGVVAHLMTCRHDLVVQLRMLAHIVAHHKESGMDTELSESLQNEWCCLGDRTIVKREVYRTLILVHHPCRSGI